MADIYFTKCIHKHVCRQLHHLIPVGSHSTSYFSWNRCKLVSKILMMMMTLTILFATARLLLSSEVHGFEFYQSVEGKCSDLPSVQEYDYRKVATGIFYHPYVSFGQEGDKCANCRVIARGLRGLTNYGNTLVFDSKKNRYISFTADLTYHPNKPGTYTIASGGVGQIIAFDSNENGLYVQCVEEDGQTKIAMELLSRSPKLDEDGERLYKDVTAKLAKLKLLPKMHKVPQTDCPPLKEVDYV